jgi:hypothetical protein
VLRYGINSKHASISPSFRNITDLPRYAKEKNSTDDRALLHSIISNLVMVFGDQAVLDIVDLLVDSLRIPHISSDMIRKRKDRGEIPGLVSVFVQRLANLVKLSDVSEMPNP